MSNALAARAPGRRDPSPESSPPAANAYTPQGYSPGMIGLISDITQLAAQALKTLLQLASILGAVAALVLEALLLWAVTAAHTHYQTPLIPTPHGLYPTLVAGLGAYAAYRLFERLIALSSVLGAKAQGPSA